MKAVIIEEHGGPEVLRYVDAQDPVPGPGEVLIRVGALTVNPGPDVQTREGRFGMPGFQLPHIGGSDPAGEVVALGEGVTSPQIGARVRGMRLLPSRIRRQLLSEHETLGRADVGGTR
jgi:NADPH:quinone reductase-like Zn-dependent oxidoreductase